VAFWLTLAFALHKNALEISSHVSWSAYLLQKEEIAKKINLMKYSMDSFCYCEDKD
jgi:hypothetical protein